MWRLVKRKTRFGLPLLGSVGKQKPKPILRVAEPSSRRNVNLGSTLATVDGQDPPHPGRSILSMVCVAQAGYPNRPGPQDGGGAAGHRRPPFCWFLGNHRLMPWMPKGTKGWGAFSHSPSQTGFQVKRGFIACMRGVCQLPCKLTWNDKGAPEKEFLYRRWLVGLQGSSCWVG